jgi:hypothetical protein
MEEFTRLPNKLRQLAAVAVHNDEWIMRESRGHGPSLCAAGCYMHCRLWAHTEAALAAGEKSIFEMRPAPYSLVCRSSPHSLGRNFISAAARSRRRRPGAAKTAFWRDLESRKSCRLGFWYVILVLQQHTLHAETNDECNSALWRVNYSPVTSANKTYRIQFAGQL